MSQDPPIINDPPAGPPADPPADPPIINDPSADPPADPPHFSATLGGEVSNHPGLQKFADVTALGKGYLEVEKALGAQGVRVPGEDSTDEQREAYYAAIGVPESPAGYHFQENVEIPDGLDWDMTEQDRMLAVMHEAKLTPEQVAKVSQAFINRQAEILGTAIVDAKTAKANAEIELKREWGSAYDANVRGATLAMKHIYGDDFKTMATMQMADGTMLGNHPAFLRGMAAVGKTYEEHNVEGMADRRRMTMTPEEASAELNRLQHDEEFQKQLHEKDNPAHTTAVQRQNDLYAMRAAGGSS